MTCLLKLTNIDNIQEHFRQAQRQGQWECKVDATMFKLFVTIFGFSSDSFLDTLSIFYFTPVAYSKETSDDRADRIRLVFTKAENVEEIVKKLSKEKVFLPVTAHDIEAMLNTMRSFLHYLRNGRDRCIVDCIYKEAVYIVKKNRLLVAQNIKRDSEWPTKFLYIVEHTKMAFVDRVPEYLDYTTRSRSDLREEFRDLKYFAERRLLSQIGSLDGVHDKVGTVKLPNSLKPTTKREKDSDKKNGKGKGRKRRQNDSDDDEADVETNIHVPKKRQSWMKLPDNKRMSNFFSTQVSAGRANLDKLPKVKHHAKPKHVVPCPHFFLLGNCNQGNNCRRSHNEDLTEESLKEFRTSLEEIFGGT